MTQEEKTRVDELEDFSLTGGAEEQGITTISSDLIRGHINTIILRSLYDGDKYGYEMIAELEAKSDHTFTLKEGTLYPILHTLERDGAVKSYEKEAPTGRTRKYYHVTKKGLRLLDEKKEEWTEFSKTVNAILAGTAPALA